MRYHIYFTSRSVQLERRTWFVYRNFLKTDSVALGSKADWAAVKVVKMHEVVGEKAKSQFNEYVPNTISSFISSHIIENLFLVPILDIMLYCSPHKQFWV